MYGKAFLGISVYSPRLERIEFLAERIARTYHGFNKEFHRKDAELLVEEDASSGTKETGQNVREAFPLADVFIRMSRRQEVREQLSPVIRILFSYPFHTPSRDEFGMFHAKSTALRSADLSRQVGAVVISADGDLLCVGCNEVPRAGGGSVWEGDPNDYRDFQIGHDSSATLKDEIVGEVIDALKHGDWLSSKKSKIPTSELVEEALYQGGRVLKPTRVTSILEFGRIVHAEMNALMDAARRGVSVKGATLYCTTFPCHMCAVKPGLIVDSFIGLFLDTSDGLSLSHHSLASFA